MDTSRISFGEMVAAASAVALLIIMLVLDWFGYKVEGGAGFGGFDAGASAFQWMSFLDIVLLLIVILAVGQAIGRAAGALPELPYPPALIVTAAGALAVLIILFRIILPGDGPAAGGLEAAGVDVTRKIGAFIGLIAAGGIAFGGYTALNERGRGSSQAPGSPGRPGSPGTAGTPRT